MLLRPPDAQFRKVDDVCLGPSDPRTPADLMPDVRDTFIEYLPTAQPSFQPADGAIVNLPTIFAANQPTAPGRTSFTLAGYAIEVEAAPTWAWDFGDGETMTTDNPGGVYPDKSVTHTYGTAAPHTVTLTTSWQGRFWIDGFGPIDLDGPPITQTSGPVPVEVREARSVLVAD